MNELLKKTKIDLANKKPRDVGKRLPRMKTEGELAKRNGDDETAFIYFKRWLNIVEWIKTTKTYKDDSSYYDKTFSINKENEVRAIFSEVEKKVIALYAPKKLELEIEDESLGESRLKGKKTSTEVVLDLPETPTDEPLAKEPDDFITPLQVFQLIKPKNRPLIIDVRSKEDYQESRIKSDRCINIPADKIKTGVLAASYERLFARNKAALRLFEDRGCNNTDIIVMLDWSTTSSTFFPGNKMRVLRDILENWDPGSKAPRIAILDGGYSDWLNRYPSLVTNANVKAPELQTNAMDEILEDVKYPEWISQADGSSPFCTFEKTEKCIDDMIANRSKKKEEVSSSIEKNSSLARNERSSATRTLTLDEDPVDGIKYPYKLASKKMSEITRHSREKSDNRDIEDMNVDEDEGIFDATRLPNESTLHTAKTKPRIDRSSKPSRPTNGQSSNGEELIILKNQLNDLLKRQEPLENEILSIERKIYEQDKNDCRGTSEKSKRVNLMGALQSLNLDLLEVINKKDQVMAALSKKSVLLHNTTLCPNEEKEKCKLDLSIGSTQARLKLISLKRNALNKQVRSEEEAKINMLAPKINVNGITKEPLKSDGSSANTGLKRSHSSPNLAQQDNGKIPLVDRSSKPRTPLAQIPNRSTISINSKLTWKDREQRMEPIFRDTRPGITGLKNLGNSCYMNSIIQCLSNNIRLAKYFNEDAYLDDLNRSVNNCKQGQVADEVAHVIKALWRGQYKSISPRDLKVVIGQYRLQFDCNDQQDSHEFLVFLLEWLHNDLKKGDDYYLDGVSLARRQWFKEIGNGESIISELFIGQLKSSIICTTCNNRSVTYETFNSLTLSLPNTNRCTLDDCVKKYVTGQKVSGWTCDNCKVPREATKKFDFIKLPPTVVIHLNRFAENEGWLQKSSTSVDFPLADLNLASYLVDDGDSKHTQSQYDFQKMSLYAVSVHYGTMAGGHYTAYCRNVGQHKWYKYDDQLVSEVSPSEVKNQGTSAYLLFYTTIENESYPYIQRSPLTKLGRL